MSRTSASWPKQTSQSRPNGSRLWRRESARISTSSPGPADMPPPPLASPRSHRDVWVPRPATSDRRPPGSCAGAIRGPPVAKFPRAQGPCSGGPGTGGDRRGVARRRGGGGVPDTRPILARALFASRPGLEAISSRSSVVTTRLPHLGRVRPAAQGAMRLGGIGRTQRRASEGAQSDAPITYPPAALSG